MWHDMLNDFKGWTPEPMVAADGFYLSHTVEPVDVPTQDHIDGFLPPRIMVEGLRPDWPAVIDASRQAAGRLGRGVQFLLRKNRVEVLAGRGSLAGGGQVRVRMVWGGVDAVIGF